MNAIHTRSGRRNTSAANRTALERWVFFYNEWLYWNVVSTTEAAAFAREDGLTWATRKRIAVVGGKLVGKWLKGSRRRRKPRQLDSRGWRRIENALRDFGRNTLVALGTVCRVAIYLKDNRRISQPPSVVGESLRSIGITLPYREPRPACPADVYATNNTDTEDK